MDIVIFQDLTTEEKILQLEADGAKYDGLYVDMDNKDERKYVKDKAKLIGDLLKKVERARIDKSAEEKRNIEAEAKSITSRLIKANEPYTLLIDEYTKERAIILTAEKARKKAIEDNIKLESDHELAILMYSQYNNDRERREAQAKADKEQQVIDQAAHDKKVAEDAAEKAKQIELSRQAFEAAQQKRLEDQRKDNHRIASETHSAILKVLTDAGISEEDGKTCVRLLAKGDLPKAFIKY